MDRPSDISPEGRNNFILGYEASVHCNSLCADESLGFLIRLKLSKIQARYDACFKLCSQLNLWPIESAWVT